MILAMCPAFKCYDAWHHKSLPNALAIIIIYIKHYRYSKTDKNAEIDYALLYFSLQNHSKVVRCTVQYCTVYCLSCNETASDTWITKLYQTQKCKLIH